MKIVFFGKHPVPNKISINNKIIQRLKPWVHTIFLDGVDIAHKICKYNNCTLGWRTAMMRPLFHGSYASMSSKHLIYYACIILNIPDFLESVAVQR